MSISIAIVEDDENCANTTGEYIKRFEKESGKAFNITFFKNGICFLNGYTAVYDVVFMDIQMPHMDRLETARKLREIDSAVCLIFITNMAQYAINGYEVSAIDYLVKPVDYFNFCLRLKKALKIIQSRTVEYLTILQNGVHSRIAVPHIYYIEVENHYLKIHTGQGVFETRGSLKDYEKRLRNYGFVKCNHCYLVNMAYISSVTANFAVLLNGVQLQISRPKRKEFLDELTSYKSIR